MNRYRKIFHHIDIKDVKDKHLEESIATKLKQEKRIEEEKYITAEAEKLKVDWRKELEEEELKESDWTDVTQGMKVGATFQHISGTSITVSSGLGGEDVHSTAPVTVDWGFGETEQVAPPTFTELPLAGIPMPVSAAMPMHRQNTKKKAKEINKQLDASEKVTAKAKADALMKARVDTSIEPNAAERIKKAGWTFGKYLLGNLKPGSWNDYLGEGYVQNAFRTGIFKSDNGGVTVGDNVIGSAGKLVYDEATDSYKMVFKGLGFKDNKNQFKEKEYAEWKKGLYNALGPYSADAQPSLGAYNPIGGLVGVVSGLLIAAFKALGK
jgi:hypothetical protein